jgi:hypothetical protein
MHLGYSNPRHQSQNGQILTMTMETWYRSDDSWEPQARSTVRQSGQDSPDNIGPDWLSLPLPRPPRSYMAVYAVCPPTFSIHNASMITMGRSWQGVPGEGTKTNCQNVVRPDTAKLWRKTYGAVTLTLTERWHRTDMQMVHQIMRAENGLDPRARFKTAANSGRATRVIADPLNIKPKAGRSYTFWRQFCSEIDWKRILTYVKIFFKCQQLQSRLC